MTSNPYSWAWPMCLRGSVPLLLSDAVPLVHPATLILIPYIFKSNCHYSMENNFFFLKAEKGELFNVTTLEEEHTGPMTPQNQLWCHNIRLRFPKRAQLSSSSQGEVPPLPSGPFQLVWQVVRSMSNHFLGEKVPFGWYPDSAFFFSQQVPRGKLYKILFCQCLKWIHISKDVNCSSSCKSFD